MNQEPSFTYEVIMVLGDGEVVDGFLLLYRRDRLNLTPIAADGLKQISGKLGDRRDVPQRAFSRLKRAKNLSHPSCNFRKVCRARDVDSANFDLLLGEPDHLGEKVSRRT